MPVCTDDGYPMVPVRDAGAGGMAWACTNPWHPDVPGPCPACGSTGRPRSRLRVGSQAGKLTARCAACHHEWVPFGA